MQNANLEIVNPFYVSAALFFLVLYYIHIVSHGLVVRLYFKMVLEYGASYAYFLNS